MKKIASTFPVFVFVIAVTVFPFNTASAQVGLHVGVFGGYTFSPNASLPYYNYNYPESGVKTIAKEFKSLNIYPGNKGSK